jgi:hypothetical protein
MSGTHAKIYFFNGKFILEDMGSTNGYDIVYNLELGFALVSFVNGHNLLYWMMVQFLRLAIQ